MKILLIASDIGHTAPGIVFSTIIKELEKYEGVSLSIITPKMSQKVAFDRTSFLPTFNHCFINYRIESILFKLLGFNLFDYLWLSIAKLFISKGSINSFDIIISLTSNHHYCPVLLGNYLASKYKTKWAIYSVDAIPAPVGWSKYDSLYRNTQKFISKYISNCDAFYASNQQMLKYQLMPIKRHVHSNIIFTPIRDEIKQDRFQFSNKHCPVFLYTGNIYGPRRCESLIEGFKMFHKENPDSKLVFVGITNVDYFIRLNKIDVDDGIGVNKYCDDLSVFYSKASVLVDLNAYFDDDVFLSSKIVNYLPLMLPIISITGQNSPSRNIFTGDPSIIHCTHDVFDVYYALNKAVNTEVDFILRDKYLRQFSAKNIVFDFYSDISIVVND